MSHEPIFEPWHGIPPLPIDPLEEMLLDASVIASLSDEEDKEN